MSRAKSASAALAERAEALAVDLLGPPSYRSGHEWRWGGNLRWRVFVSGPRRGQFTDWAAHQHGDLLDLIHATRGGSMADALRWAESWLGDPELARQSIPKPAAPDPEDESTAQRRRIGLALRIWKEAGPMQGTAVETYLRGRGIALADWPEALRFHPRCATGPRQPDGSLETAPAMLGLLRDLQTGEPCGVHRTFLRPDGSGKAEMDQPKRMLGRAAGAAVKLSPDDAVSLGLGIAEGIETGLSLLAMGWAPIWCCGSAGGIAAFPTLPGIEALTIFADGDPTGLRAAEACAERWREAGREARIIPPCRSGADWNDAARERAA